MVPMFKTNAPQDLEELEERLSCPSAALVNEMAQIEGDILFLGAGGKLGPSITRMAKRATDEAGVSRRIIAVSRFSNQAAREQLNACGVETVAADLMSSEQLSALPDAANVIFMAGHKFGIANNPSSTWAMNSYLPGRVMERYSDSRIAAFSTGCVYGLSPLTQGGAIESDPLLPTDEYSMSCIGRERMVEHFSKVNQTPATILRLNYAVEMRYGVLVDIASAVFTDQPIDLTMGYCNVIWQGDANAMALRSLALADTPAFAINLVGPELLSVRRIADSFAQIFGKEVRFTGTESPECLLTNGNLCQQVFGYPQVPVQAVIEWTAEWIRSGGQTLNKPTGFQVRDGKY
ncbi:NAD dependent epimerase/dehydratase family protein [Roseimaritima multifibrata]|uniref:NAD dependent epimerase/dehydratase family protein n=2 Tax=Roseimaritima multifibrata TaxID=1930274 RepID=A0A517MFZ9_9BACT|nr:NAD dependent epimerase/dehydratase family protein [Roseimaritima multifibrata]